MSARLKRRGEDLEPPERRRRLNKDGVGETRQSNHADVARPASEPPRAEVLRELLKRYAQDSIAGAQKIVISASELCDETNEQSEALKKDNMTLRMCTAELLGVPTLPDCAGSAMHLWSLARGSRRAQKKNEQGLTAAVSRGEAALERERTMRLQAQQEAQAFRALSTAKSSEVEEEMALRKTAEGDQRHYKLMYKMAKDALRQESVARTNVAIEAETHRKEAIAASNALAGERRRVETLRQRRQHYQDLVTFALQGLEGKGAGRKTNVGEPRQYTVSLRLALAGLKRERARRKGEAQALAAAIRTAELAQKEEKAKREAAEDGARCVICMSNTRNTVLLPCTHLVLCDKCPRVSECPICRARVRRTMPVILS